MFTRGQPPFAIHREEGDTLWAISGRFLNSLGSGPKSGA
jgi:hypothetical protein